MSKKIKILFDISHGIHGTTGIQQDMRRILAQLIKDDAFQVDFLVYDMLNNVPYITFDIQDNINKYGNLVAQSRLLYHFFNPKGEESLGGGKYLGRIRRRQYKKLLVRQQVVQTIKIDKVFNESLYKRLLQDDSSIDILAKIRQSDFLLSTFSTESVILGMIDSHYELPFLNTKDYDLVIFFQELPIKISLNTKKLVRSYDLIQILGPDVVFKADYKSNYQYRSIKECKKQGSTFCTISQTVANQMKDMFGNDLDTRYIPVAISDVFKSKKDSFNIAEYAKTHLVRQHHFSFNQKVSKEKFDYFLSVSTIEPRKNIISSYYAFKMLKMQKKYKNLKFVLVGKIGWNLNSEYQNMFLDEDVIVLANVPTRDLPYLYSNARALVYVPFSEGFGVPPVEAMACGCPVILSDILVHREIHEGGEPLFVNHYSVDDIAEKMKWVLDKKNQKETQQRITKAIKHANKYSIKETGKQWHDFLLKLVEKS